MGIGRFKISAEVKKKNYIPILRIYFKSVTGLKVSVLTKCLNELNKYSKKGVFELNMSIFNTALRS
jgi:hypothetical protein